MIGDRSAPIKSKVLIVDDMPDNLRLLSETLSRRGFDVQCAISGELALIGVNANPPDVILLDIKMPQMDGYTVCERLKASEHRHIPILFLSALDEPFDKVKAFRVGGADYITKPFQIEEVIVRIEHQLALQRARSEIAWLNASLEQQVRERTTELQQLSLDLQISEERFRMVTNVAPVMIWMADTSGRCTFLNQRWTEFTGRTLEQELQDGWQASIHPDDARRFLETYRSAFATHQSFMMEYRLRRTDQTYRWVLNTGIPLVQAQGEFVGYIGSCIDIHDRKQAEEQLLYNALHDSLTDLPNRSLLIERLELALCRIHRHPHALFAILFLDLDRFKLVNDSLGHLVGDQLLMAIADRLETAIRGSDLMARLGGDEFVILLDEVDGINDAIRVAERILSDLRSPFWIEGRELFMTVSIGIVLGTPDYKQGSELLRDADIAMYQAKGKGKARYELFNSHMHTEAIKRLQLESDLRRAIEHNQFVLHYQPIVSLATGKIVEFEALIRWQHPLRGLLLPGEFIPTVEETGLINVIGRWVLRTACHQLKQWQTQFPSDPPLGMSVNLSAQQLRDADWLDRVDQVLAETGIPASSLTLELTESMLIDNVEQVIALLAQLRSRSVQLSIDDFGTGYSSLSYLHRFPIHALKIDRSFVSRMSEPHQPYNMTDIIITLTHQLGLVAIAEGVETAEQLHKLQTLKCELAQGYFLAHPLTVEAAERLLCDQSRNFNCF